MDDTAVLLKLRSELSRELQENLLPYWLKQAVDNENGGYTGRINYRNETDPHALKGAILHTRLLWTFSACYKKFGHPDLKKAARRTYDYLVTHFLDEQYGGVFWELDAKGKVNDGRKYIYAHAFAIYAFSEYAEAFSDSSAFNLAVELYRLIELKSADPVNGGYFEAFSRDWELLEDVRMSEKDLNEPKSMNTHLHLLEAYTNLYRYSPLPGLHTRLSSLIKIILECIINEKGTSLVVFLDSDWAPRSRIISYGHDIEASWLMMEAARVLADDQYSVRVTTTCMKIARAVLNNGLDHDGGLLNEADPTGIIDYDKEWWPQAEAMTGFLNAWEHDGDHAFLEAAVKVWNFIQKYIVDHEYGEWIPRVDREGVSYKDDKVRNWKSGYHNIRACLEGIQRIERLTGAEIESREYDPAIERSGSLEEGEL